MLHKNPGNAHMVFTQSSPAGGAARRVHKTLIFGSPPNPNGDLHLGHLAGPYMAADVLARHRRMLGEQAYYAVGTDDNQCWTAAMARKLGQAPQATADQFAAEIEKTMSEAKLDVDVFYRPNARPKYLDIVNAVVRKLFADGHLVARESPCLYCESCDQYLFESYVSGTCPHCEKPTCGNACEECGIPNDCVDMVNPVCNGCGKPRVNAASNAFTFLWSRIAKA